MHSILYVHCLKNNQNPCIKTEPAVAGVDAPVYVWFLGQIYSTVQYVNKCRTYAVKYCPYKHIISSQETIFHSALSGTALSLSQYYFIYYARIKQGAQISWRIRNIGLWFFPQVLAPIMMGSVTRFSTPFLEEKKTLPGTYLNRLKQLELAKSRETVPLRNALTEKVRVHQIFLENSAN